MKIGWIGTGVMGAPMAGHLQAAGHSLFVFNRSKDKARALLERGATWCASPADTAMEAECVFTMVGHPADVEDVYCGKEGVFSVKGPARAVVDMTTSPPSLAEKIARTAAERGIASLDAPVSGGDIGARNAQLAIMVGGERKAYDDLLPLFRTLGNNISYMGGPGSGQHTKMCNQILIAGTIAGACESLLYAEVMKLDVQAVIDIIGKGAAGSWTINNLGPRVVHGDYGPGFFVEHFIKDMGIALREAEAYGLSLPGLALVHQLYVAVKSQGHGRMGTQALILGLRALNGR